MPLVGRRNAKNHISVHFWNIVYGSSLSSIGIKTYKFLKILWKKWLNFFQMICLFITLQIANYLILKKNRNDIAYTFLAKLDVSERKLHMCTVGAISKTKDFFVQGYSRVFNAGVSTFLIA